MKLIARLPVAVRQEPEWPRVRKGRTLRLDCGPADDRFRREAVIEQTQTLIGAPPNSTRSTSPLVRVGFGSFPAVPACQRRGRSTSISGPNPANQREPTGDPSRAGRMTTVRLAQ
jgi:hypothetical protein